MVVFFNFFTAKNASHNSLNALQAALANNLPPLWVEFKIASTPDVYITVDFGNARTVSSERKSRKGQKGQDLFKNMQRFRLVLGNFCLVASNGSPWEQLFPSLQCVGSWQKVPKLIKKNLDSQLLCINQRLRLGFVK